MEIEQFVTIAPKEIIKIDKLVSAYDYLFSPAYQFNGERHKHWEVVGVFDGVACIISHDKKLLLHENEFFIHEPFEFHAIYPHHGALHVGVFGFESDSVALHSISDRILRNPDQITLFTNLLKEGLLTLAGLNSVPPLNPKDVPPLATDQATKVLGEYFLINLLRTQSEPANPKVKTIVKMPLDATLSQKIIEFLHLYIYQNIKLETIADAFGYSKEHICRIFKSEIGKSIIDYYIDIRIEKAKQLLSSGKYTILDVHKKLNYSTPQYFTNQFKKKTGLTPSQFCKPLKHQHWRNWNLSSQR